MLDLLKLLCALAYRDGSMSGALGTLDCERVLKAEIKTRIAVQKEAAALSQLGEQCFRAAFANDNRPEDINTYVAESFSIRLLESELSNPNIVYLVATIAEHHSRYVGYAKLRSDRTDGSVNGGSPIELERLYVHPDWIRYGIGRVLMQESIRIALERGHKTLWLGVWERNLSAIAFYEKLGFSHVGEHPFLLGSDKQTDLIYEKSLVSG